MVRRHLIYLRYFRLREPLWYGWAATTPFFSPRWMATAVVPSAESAGEGFLTASARRAEINIHGVSSCAHRDRQTDLESQEQDDHYDGKSEIL